MSLYERFTFRGHTLDRMTIAALLCAEHRLGYSNVILQGSYNAGGVTVSSGTHDGGGAVDLVWRKRFGRQNRALRKWACMAGWPRRATDDWNRHYHGIVLGNNKASLEATGQMVTYRQGGDGLAGTSGDAFPWRPDPIRDFNYLRAGIVSWERLNKIARSRTKTAFLPAGRRQIATVDRALRGFGMNTAGHRAGRMDRPLIDALARFARIRHVGDTEVEGPVSPKVLYELCVPSIESTPR